MSHITKVAIQRVWLCTIFSLFSASVLVGCSSFEHPKWQPTQVSDAAAAKAWELQGKLAVSSPEEKFSTNLYWLHQPQQDDIKLTTMLGTSVMTLHSEPGKAQLELDGKTYQDKDPQVLLNRLANWQFPLNELPRWLLGIVGTEEQLTRDGQGLPLSLVSTQVSPPWQLHYQGWQQQSGATIPRLLKLERGALQLKIQLTQWQALRELPLESRP